MRPGRVLAHPIASPVDGNFPRDVSLRGCDIRRTAEDLRLQASPSGKSTTLVARFGYGDRPGVTCPQRAS